MVDEAGYFVRENKFRANDEQICAAIRRFAPRQIGRRREEARRDLSHPAVSLLPISRESGSLSVAGDPSRLAGRRRAGVFFEIQRRLRGEKRGKGEVKSRRS